MKKKKDGIDFEKHFVVSLVGIVLICLIMFVVASLQQSSITTNTSILPAQVVGASKGQKLFLLGGSNGTNLSDNWSSTDLVNNIWSSAGSGNGGCPTNEVEMQHVVYFKNELWAVGGAVNNIRHVCKSGDGINWSLVTLTPNSTWTPRTDNGLVVFNDGNGDAMYILGGADQYGTELNDVWYSIDGIDWIQKTQTTGWVPRRGMTTLVYANKIWVIGGEIAGNVLSDSWASYDGVSWMSMGNGPWGPRTFMSGAVLDNKIWLFGGSDGTIAQHTDSYYYETGLGWTTVPATGLSWSARYKASSIVVDKKMWLLGGKSIGPNTFLNDVWSSSNGSSWTLSPANGAIWGPRIGPGVVATPVAFGAPDLIVTSLTLTQPLTTTSTWVRFNVTIKNNSAIPVTLPLSFRVYVNSAPMLAAGTPFAVNSLSLNSILLAPNQSYTYSNLISKSITAHPTVGAAYTMTAKVDATSIIAESNENNNTLSTIVITQ